MSRLLERYEFDWRRIQNKDAFHIEYSITDICNRSCAHCSHLAPLAKQPNFVGAEEFARVLGTIRKLIPQAHTVWLTGGEPTLHPEFLKLLRLAREIYSDCFIGIYSNGVTLKSYEDNDAFWDFTRTNGIVWAITHYDSSAQYFESLFERHGCLNNLAIVQSGRTFLQLVNYSQSQPFTREKYEKCGWEKSKINIRNGKIFNCPSAEFADLFNAHFNRQLEIGEKDYLWVDEKLDRKEIDAFRGPTPFCGNCDISKRHAKIFKNTPSHKSIGEWSDFKLD